MDNKNTNLEHIKKSLSSSRISSYKRFAKTNEQIFALYQWNLQISSALFECLSICEVVIRNAISEALIATYGKEWHLNNNLLEIMKTEHKNKLLNASENGIKNPEIITKLSFGFWKHFFTRRFDEEIWSKYWEMFLPNANFDTLPRMRENIFEDLNLIIKLRNRIAHHEPIFKLDLKSYYERILRIIGYFCLDTANLVKSWQKFESLLENKPNKSD